MPTQRVLFKLPPIESDIVYTQKDVVLDILKFLQPSGLILDPCKGDGAFYNELSPSAEYCELDEGKDFFDYNKRVDWIIGNPPYSIFLEFLEKSFELAENISFLVPTNKIFQRQIVMEKINKFGGIKSMIVYGSGSLIGFPFGFSVGNFHFQKDYKGETKIRMGMQHFTSITEARIKRANLESVPMPQRFDNDKVLPLFEI